MGWFGVARGHPSLSAMSPFDRVHTTYYSSSLIETVRSSCAVYYPNVTTLRSGLCCRNSVCRLSVTLVHPTQGVEAFGKMSSLLCTLPSSDLRAKFYGDSPRGTYSSVRSVKRKRGIKIERFWTSKAISHKRYKIDV